MPVTNATFYVHQVALGLAHAYETGMVHRDIKPTNLMLAIKNKKHIVKILDFGLAKATSEKVLDAGLTKSGQVLGTPHYIAPEQTLNAQKADIRADIYSLGCTLYYLLAGSPPFRGESMFAILQAHHQAEAPPLNQIRGDVPAELMTVVSTMMAKDPNRRYQTPLDVAKALKRFFKAGVSASVQNVQKQSDAMTDLPPSAVDEPEAEAAAAISHEPSPVEEPHLEETPVPALPVATLPVVPTPYPPAELRTLPVANAFLSNPFDEFSFSNVQPATQPPREEPRLSSHPLLLVLAVIVAALLATAMGVGVAMLFSGKPAPKAVTAEAKAPQPVVLPAASPRSLGVFVPLFNGQP